MAAKFHNLFHRNELPVNASWQDQMLAGQRQQAMADALQQGAMTPRQHQQGRIVASTGGADAVASLAQALLSRRKQKQATTTTAAAEEARRQAQAQALAGMGGQDPQQTGALGPPEPANPYARGQEAIEAGVDPNLVAAYMKQQAPDPNESPFGVIDPGKFTPESLQKFAQTREYGDLVPQQNMYGRYNPGDYTPASWADFQQSNDPSVLVRFAPNRIVNTAGGGVAAVDPINATSREVITDEAGTGAAASRAEAEAAGTARGAASGKAEGAILSRATNAQGINDILDIADPLIDVATGSGGGAARDRLFAFFGESTEGDQAIGQLRVLQAAVMLAMPRMEGPQSDRDVQLYREAAAELGDPSVPNARKKAAVSTIRQMQQKYVERASGAEVPAPPAATQEGSTFASEAEATAAAQAGQIKPGQRITVGGISGTWQ